MNDYISYFLKRPKVTNKNKEFYTIRYLARSTFYVFSASILVKLYFKKRFLGAQKFLACYYLGYSLRKINNLLIISEEENL